MHENISVEIDTAVFDKLLQSRYVGAVSWMLTGHPKIHGAPRYDKVDQLTYLVPPGAAGLKFIIQIGHIRVQPFNRTPMQI